MVGKYIFQINFSLEHFYNMETNILSSVETSHIIRVANNTDSRI